MSSSRRDFLHAVGAGAALLGAAPALGLDLSRARAMTAPSAPSPFDLTWPAKVTGRHRAIFDVAAIESGNGVARASLWEMQYQQFLGAKPADLSAVIVIRAEGIPLALRQSFWDQYGIGKAKGVTHPLTGQPIDRNPALLSSKSDGIPPEFDDVALDRFLARGGIVLACDLALQEVAAMIVEREKVSETEGHARAVAALIPGVILQPSGVFAVVRGQEAGCQYVRAS
ncbi:MAG: twin-arginine translocation signal domain-containing protein [Gemmatirosa sp.]|nr:twin-arginine translocation signal domain-containing protein [Gemmatirosa sp.]